MESNLFDENISNFRFVVWDTETSGVSVLNDHVVEIAALAFDEDFEHRKFEKLIKPPITLSNEVIRIHGITNEMLTFEQPAREVLRDFTSFLNLCGKPRVLIAHNAGFDIGMVRAELVRLPDAREFESFDEIVLDSCMLAKNLLPDLAHHKLSALAEHFKIDTNQMHRAAEDVRILKEVFMKLLGLAADRMTAAGNGFTLGNLVDLCGGYFRFAFTPTVKPRELSRKNLFKGMDDFFKLPPKLELLEEIMGTETKVSICYETDNGDRYITPMSLEFRGFRLYLKAFCHRDQIQKKFRIDKILKAGRTLAVLVFFCTLSLALCSVSSYAQSFSKNLNKPWPSCNGKYGSASCSSRIYFNGCQELISFSWKPTTLPSSTKWAKKTQNTCEIQIETSRFKRKKQVFAAACFDFLETIRSATKIFPEKNWLDEACRGRSVAKENAFIDRESVFFIEEKEKINAVQLAGLELCSFESAKELRCSVIGFEMARWLEKLARTVGFGISYKNVEK